MGTLDYHNFSIKGDARWAGASRVTVYAPLVVLSLFVLSLIQVVIGAVWVVDLQSDMTVPKILQTLILPGLSFFNTLPSLHLHMLVRRNPPAMALSFSSILAVLWFTSAILYLAACSDSSSASVGLQRTECAKGHRGVVVYGPGPGLWGVVVALSLVSAVLYASHAGMAAYVMMVVRRKEKEDKVNGVPAPEEVDPNMAQEARDRWMRLQRFGAI